MSRIKDESVERVKAALEILPLVEDVVRLRKAGSTYKGLCPFHQERTPSFTVSPARGTAGVACGAGGLRAGGAARRRARESARQRLLPAPDRVPIGRRTWTRARVPGTEAARRRPVAGEVRQLAGGRAVPERRPPLRTRHGAPGDRARGPGGRRRGKH